MKTSSLWIIRLALAVQFVGVLAVPSLVAATDSPRAMWMAEWLRPQPADLSPEAPGAKGERTIGVLRVRDGQLSFVEQIGQVEWELDLANVKRVAPINGGRSLSIVSVAGEEYVFSIMDLNMTPASPKKALGIIERAIQSLAANHR
jgi:hypothetical protein